MATSKYSEETKMAVVLEGLKNGSSIAELCPQGFESDLSTLQPFAPAKLLDPCDPLTYIVAAGRNSGIGSTLPRNN